MDQLDRFFSIIAGYLDQYLILPILYHCGWMAWEELSFDWALVCVYGLFAVLVTYAVCWPLEALLPVERWESKKTVFIDAVYTVVSRVGVIPVFSFLLFYQLQTYFSAAVVDAGYIPPDLEMIFPVLFGHPVVTFFIYALILDFADYWRHRFSHTYRAWYALHALHHAQRQMSFWSDDRNHIFDELISFLWFFAIGLAIGIPPLQFPRADALPALRGEHEPRQHQAAFRPVRISAGLAALPPPPPRDQSGRPPFLQLRRGLPDLGHPLPQRGFLRCVAANGRSKGRRSHAYRQLFPATILGRQNLLQSPAWQTPGNSIKVGHGTQS